MYRSTGVSGRVIWHLGYTEEASAAALTQAYQEFQRAGPSTLVDVGWKEKADEYRHTIGSSICKS